MECGSPLSPLPLFHLLIGLRPDASLSDLMRDIKANSSRFINEKRWVMAAPYTDFSLKRL